jgi:Zn-dependent M28 family amino/carboxypeptidase
MVDQRLASRKGALRLAALGAAVAFTTALFPGQAASAAPRNACDNRANNTYQKLLDCVTAEGVQEHLEAFQKIADNSTDPVYPGTRAAGTDGYADSVDYVANLLREAGYEVTLDPVEITFNFPAVLRQLTPTPAANYESGVFTGSGDGNVQANVIPVDINLTGDRASTSGCDGAFTEAAVGAPIVADPGGSNDFAGFPSGSIALIQRGGCSFALKAANAQAAGASAVVLFNQGNAPDREALIVGNAAAPTGSTSPAISIPVVGASFEDGAALARAGSTAQVTVRPAETRTDYNVIAELPGKNEDNVVMAGAHLDSVIEGPGINDNGSGSAALLETALLMANLNPENTLRFAWWAGEEQGLLGSADYVAGLSEAERDRIALYMNYDMVGSPNYIFMVYDADESTFPAPAGVPIPAGSEAIEDLYESYYTAIGEPYDDTEFSGRSDYEAFILAGIPSSGLFTGAEGIKTEEQEAIWGGEAGEQYDPCYHEACDTIANINEHALDVNSDLIAFAMLTFAYSTESVNDVPGKKVPGPRFTLPAPAGPEGTFAEGSSAGLSHGAKE